MCSHASTVQQTANEEAARREREARHARREREKDATRAAVISVSIVSVAAVLSVAIVAMGITRAASILADALRHNQGGSDTAVGGSAASAGSRGPIPVAPCPAEVFADGLKNHGMQAAKLYAATACVVSGLTVLVAGRYARVFK